MSVNPNPLGHLMDHVPPSSNETPDLADVGAYPPISSSDLVLGYPESTPPDVDLGPMPSGAGAKPSGKSNTAPPRPEPKVGRTPTPVPNVQGLRSPSVPRGVSLSERLSLSLSRLWDMQHTTHCFGTPPMAKSQQERLSCQSPGRGS